MFESYRSDTTYLTIHDFDSLHKEISGSLQAGQVKIEKTLDRNLEQVSVSVASTEKDTRKVLADYLTASMQGELAVTKKVLNESLIETADPMANMLSAVSAEPILSRKFSTLID
ncbi:MAG: hypothetical protein KZQ66_06030 [Candidatus Thiodiazotropha sp. (ex Lucinoma aequizonata)]|nr:hypothetical protein [Candidatus Thiodiazotropha sp. (ex Lucinoma aequizonata)]MCU7901601.1 hypothetical protein [Candidatus Thiodiazotropha sp. (ex Lucinoma aequizonata)]